MNERIKLIDAVLLLGYRELAKDEQSVGVLRALLSEALPMLSQLRQREVLLMQLREAEAGSGERSDPASNQEIDEEIERLRKELVS